MMYDTVIKGGTVVTAAEQFAADVGIVGETIAAVGRDLRGDRVIDATGLLVLPGGVDTHCHIEQLRADGTTDEESFISASASAFAGGTTTAITFSTQFKGRAIGPSLAEYQARAARGMIDYGFHQIITDPTDAVIHEEIPALIAAGIRSLKVFLTYDPLHVDDRGFLRILAAARRHGALVTVHCENYDAIGWMTEALLAAGLTGPKYHAWSRPVAVEREATMRAIALAELVDQPIQIFHVSCSEVAEEIARAQARGLKIWAETCPQYLTLTAADMDRPGFEGAKFMCSPAPREAGAAADLWAQIRRGTIDVISSDHSGYRFDGTAGKRSAGADASFRDIPNGVPGLGARMMLLFSEGVATGRISASDFVRLTAFNPARLFGLTRKGRISPGADADIVLWDAKAQITLTNATMQHAIDYTPYEGKIVTGIPITTLRRGIIVMHNNTITAEPGSGRFIPRAAYDLIKPTGHLANNFNPSAYA
ncbi:MAG: dihydropyrimidinase [Acidiphilium sp. 37-64-53]|nr:MULTISPECIES: dihydropyrimidinase [unclassified Acidiphilium]OYW02779.1 MAG: dihydropyrimidinase [Acidiphilium sp. 37-64-53]OZB29192.1 MAG: dihydropyrimidinase [Acidiphilium sp. 34-64-41]HQT84746.1 dihydropyrimidinase [Acidiphilium rubrum]